MTEESSPVVEATVIEPTPEPAFVHPALASRDGFIDFLFPNPQRSYLRFHTQGLASSSDTFLERRPNDRWRELGGYRAGTGPTLDELAITAKWGRPRIGLALTRAHVESEIAPLMLLWVAWNIPVLEPASHPFLHALKRATAPGSVPVASPRSRIDLDTKQRVFNLIASIDPLVPHVIVDEGDRLIGLWRLDQPLVEPFAETFLWSKMRSTRLLHSMALQLGGDVRFADAPHQALVDLPGSRRDDLVVTPPPVVEATLTILEDLKPISIEQAEWWTAEGMTPAIRAARAGRTA